MHLKAKEYLSTGQVKIETGQATTKTGQVATISPSLKRIVSLLSLMAEEQLSEKR